MTYDLRTEPWIPWRRRSGAVTWGPPALLVDDLRKDGGDWIIALAAPRPDFDGALQEFLIGLLTVALYPENDDAWRERWTTPPTREELQSAIDSLSPAFDLDGDGPRFFQDLSVSDFADTESTAIEQLLIEAPGDQTTKFNKDLFTKRGRAPHFGRPAAAMALLTMQTYAPAGGQGHRTSMRGGGPLTTLVDPRIDREGNSDAFRQPLWQKLWANVQTAEQLGQHPSAHTHTAFEHSFPWLAQTRRSESDRTTTPADAHPLQSYFGLPRRIRLEFGGAGRCDLTGLDDEHIVVGFKMRNYGVQYATWRHSLSPYYGTKSGEWLPLHGQPGGVGWRDWIGLTLQTPEGLRQPAVVVSAFAKRFEGSGATRFRVHAFGYDMDNMKARGWTDANLPGFAGLDAEHERLVANAAGRLTDAVGIGASALLSAVQTALFDDPKEAPGDLSQIKGELWSRTEADFFAVMRAVADATSTIETVDDRCRTFARVIERASLVIFDRWCSAETTAASVLRRLVGARFNLVMTVKGHSKLGRKLFGALGIGIVSDKPTSAARDDKPRARKEKKT
jgi:CRISPR system Cascade subunit CasA